MDSTSAKDVVVIGFGRIGQIKARIWSELGQRVYVYDNNRHAIDKISLTPYETYKPGTVLRNPIVDISTPAGQHYASLIWALKYIPRPQAILIEKPLASDVAEIKLFKDLLRNNYSLPDIFVNESYLCSAALQHILGEIELSQSNIRNIQIELSKNRLSDVFHGRFVDESLGIYGLEMPHMIAIVQLLNRSLDDLHINENITYIGISDDNVNTGAVVELNVGGIQVILKTFMGDFRITEDNEVTSNDGIIRTIKITTDHKNYCIEFDPVPGIPRLHSRLGSESHTHQMRYKEIFDDHMKKHLLAVNNVKNISNYASYENGLQISQLLLRLRHTATVIDINNIDLKTSRYAKEGADYVN